MKFQTSLGSVILAFLLKALINPACNKAGFFIVIYVTYYCFSRIILCNQYTNDMAKTKKIDVWRCTVCKSENVEIRQWINPNTNEIDTSNGLENEDCWCQDCDEHTELEIVSKRVKI